MAAVELGSRGEGTLAPALDRLREGFAIFDERLCLRSCNARFAQLSGYPPALCTPGTPYADLVRFEYARDRPTTGDVETLVAERMARLATGKAASFDARGANGTFLSVALTPLPEGGMLLTSLDVAQLRAAERAYATMNDSLRVVIDEAPVMLCLMDRDDHMLYVSRGYLNLVRRSFDDLVARGWELDIHPDDVAPTLETVRAAHLDRRPYDHEYRLRRHDGVYRWIREVGYPRFAADGGYVGFVSQAEDVTDSKAARDMLRTITDEAPVLLFLADADNQVVYINRRNQDFVGRPRQEIMGRGWQRDIHPDDLPRVLAFAADTHGRRANGEIEYRMRRHDGVYRWVREIIVARFAPDGTFLGNVSAVEDITEREVAQSALRQSQAMLRVITDEAPVMLSMTDADDRLIYVNRRNLAFVGRPAEQILGRGWENDVHPDDLPGLLETSRAAHEQRRDHQVEYRFRRHDGVFRWIREVCVARYEADGAFAGFVSALEDVTEAKAAGDMMRVMTNEAPVMLNLSDADGLLIFVNKRTLDFVGRPADQFLGRGWERDIHPEDLPGLLERSEKYLRQRQDYQIEYRMRRHDGVYRWMRGVAVARFAPDGAFLGFVESTEDITEARVAQEELERQRETLHQSEKLAALGSLLAGVAHELNNPLSIIVTFAQLLQDAPPDPKTAARAGKIQAAADRCARIVKTFLAMARRKPAQQTRVDLNAIAASAIEVVGYGLRSSGVDVRLDLAPDLPATWADGDQLQQVVTNLVVNAEQAMAECDGPRRLRVSSRFDAASRRLHLEVADSGPGVPAPIRSRIFEPFFTTKSIGVGTGVGLSLCYSIIESHGGTITVGDAPEGGALFTMTLPHVPAEGAAVASNGNGVPLGAEPQAILVVDDEPDLAEALAEILSGAGHQVEVAADGRQALACIGARDYGLILSDLKMPGLDGPAFFKALLERHPSWRERMIFITGDTLSPAAISFLDKAGRPCIEKPFNADEVRRIVAEALCGLGAARGQAPSGTNL